MLRLTASARPAFSRRYFFSTVAGMVKWYVPARRKDVSFCRNDCLNSSRSDLSSRRRVFIRFESTR